MTPKLRLRLIAGVQGSGRGLAQLSDNPTLRLPGATLTFNERDIEGRSIRRALLPSAANSSMVLFLLAVDACSLSRTEKRKGNAAPCQMGPDPWRDQSPSCPPSVKGRYAPGRLGDCLNVPIFCSTAPTA